MLTGGRDRIFIKVGQDLVVSKYGGLGVQISYLIEEMERNISDGVIPWWKVLAE